MTHQWTRLFFMADGFGLSSISICTCNSWCELKLYIMRLCRLSTLPICVQNLFPTTIHCSGYIACTWFLPAYKNTAPLEIQFYGLLMPWLSIKRQKQDSPCWASNFIYPWKNTFDTIASISWLYWPKRTHTAIKAAQTMMTVIIYLSD